MKPLRCQLKLHPQTSLCIWLNFVRWLGHHLIKTNKLWDSKKVKTFLYSNLPIRSMYSSWGKLDHLGGLCFTDFFFHTQPIRQIGCFYTVVKYQTYFMDECFIFLIILHTFSCGSSVLKHLSVDIAGSTSGLCFMQTRKMKTKKSNSWIFIVQRCLSFLFFHKDTCWLMVPIPYCFSLSLSLSHSLTRSNCC